MNWLRALGIVSLALLGVGLAVASPTHPLYAGYDPGGRLLASMAATAACWLLALLAAGLATWRSFVPGAPADLVSVVLARGPLVLLFFAFAIRMFLFAAME